jgi:hypothetical protein
MFLLGVIVGACLVLGVLWLLGFDGGSSVSSELTVRRARQQINDLERAAINRMLDEARAQRRYRA